jgi:hypothetical protein
MIVVPIDPAKNYALMDAEALTRYHDLPVSESTIRRYCPAAEYDAESGRPLYDNLLALSLLAGIEGRPERVGKKLGKRRGRVA